MKKAFFVLILVLITVSYVFGAGLDTLPNDLVTFKSVRMGTI